MKIKLHLLAAILALPCMALSAPTVTAWGDSLTAGAGGTPWPTQFAALSGVTTNNRGVGGNTSAQILTRFLAEPARFGDFTVIWSGRNNVHTTGTTGPSFVLADIATMVSQLTTSNYLILGVLNGDYGGWDSVGGEEYADIISLNNSLAATYGNKFIDIRKILVDSYNPLSPQDVSDHARDITPTSLRSDALHLNTAGYAVVADAVYTAYEAVPEPGTWAFMALSAALFAATRLVRKNKATSR